ncbi:MAG: diguanylate cyclase [Lachnospiraceae bacterium]|nr:diguanylate cyclase [Lachnospiraceae bacterium]
MAEFNITSYDNETVKIIDAIEQGKGMQPVNTVKYTKQLQDLALEKGDLGLEAYAIYCRAQCLYLAHDPENASLLYSKALPMLLDTEQWERAARACSMMGIINSGQGSVAQAMDSYLKGLEISQDHKLHDLYVFINCNIGTLYLGFSDFQNALDSFKRAEIKCEEIRRNEGSYEPLIAYQEVAALYINIAACYCSEKTVDRAKECIHKAMELQRKSPSKALSFCTLIYRAQIHYYAGEISQSDKLIEQIDDMVKDISILPDIFDDIIRYTTFLQKVGKMDSFWNVLERMDAMVRQIDSVYLSRRLVELKIRYYKQMGMGNEYRLSTSLYYELTMKMEQNRQESFRESMALRLKLEEEKRSRKQAQNEAKNLRSRSERDALTGLNNRFRIMQILEDSLQECKEQTLPLAVEMLDVDFFKQVNDNYGHQTGDEILREVGDCLKSMQRHSGVYAGRYGGDEFIIIYKNLSIETVKAYCEELKQKLYDKKIEHEYSSASPYISLSQGAYWHVPGEEDTCGMYMEEADKVLYRVKKKSRNDYYVADQALKEEP